MSNDFNSRRKTILEKRLAELYEEYEAAYAQLGRMLSDTDALKIKRQIDYLDEAIKEVEGQLAGIGQEDEGEGNGRQTANERANPENADAAYLVKLTDILNTRFDLSELNSLAFYLSLELDDLPGEGKQRKVEELIKYLNRHQKLAELVTIGKKNRSDIAWPEKPIKQPISLQAQLPTKPQPNWGLAKTVLVDEYHGQPLFNNRLQRELKAKGFEVRTVTEAYSSELLFTSDIFVIWFARYFEGAKARFLDEEISLIKEYLEQGGAALLIGLGWVWAGFEEQPSIETYPLNLISEGYGIFFTNAIISHVSGVSHDEQPITFEKPFMSDHPVTQGVTLISAPKAAPGSLIVTPPAVSLIWGSDQLRDSDGAKNPVILAAADTGQGKLICMQHAAYINSLNDDNFTLLTNILNWLVSRADGDTK